MKVVILFKGSNCAPCKVFEPLVNKIMEEHGQGLEFLTVTDDVELMQKFGTRVVPSVVMYHKLPNGGVEVETVLSGAIRSKTLEDAVYRLKNSVPDSELKPNY
ncbi:thioredoxin [Serratia phage Slocum]|nr:thioredoxin [Serratia phage Slocum]